MKVSVAGLFRDLPIRRKLILFFVLVSSIVLLIAELFFLFDRALTFQRDQREGLNSLAAVISHNVAAPLVFNDQDSADKTMQGLNSHPGVVAGYLVDTEGRLFTSFRRHDSECGEDLVISEENTASQNLAVVQRYRDEAAESFKWCAPIGLHEVTLEGEKMGTVLLLGSITPFVSELYRQAAVALGVFLTACGLAYIVALRLQRFISTPIISLTSIMHEVSLSKNFSLRADPSASGAEIGSLFNGFNEMLAEVEERNELLRQRQDHLQVLAHFDSLTGLANRLLFHDRLSQSIHQADRLKQSIAVYFIDLDHFKDVNDSLGHRVGDLLLVEVSRRFKERMRSCDTVARLGGDEFTVFAQNIGTDGNARTVAENLLNSLALPFQVDDNELFVTASIGYTIYPQDSTTIDELMRNADLAMYFAKERGKNNCQQYQPEMNQRASSRLTLLNSLHKAVTRQEFSLVYQPQMEVATGRITGMETLIRWNHPKEGLVSPARFIPLAEETGIIVEITEWVLRETVRQILAWQREGLPVVPVAINLSAVLFKRQVIVPMLEAVLAETGINPSLLEVEVTEGILLMSENALEQMEQIRQMGITIAVDDFGTGYSSLSYIHRFPVNVLKIDKSFILNITKNPDDYSIVTAIIAMAKSLGLGVVAEGVEESEQLAYLRTQGCEEIQGYLFSRPVPPEQIAQILLTPPVMPGQSGMGT
jgi:diguanylate cyclase (GGDEF)-like protein